MFHVQNNEWKFLSGHDIVHPLPVFGDTGFYSETTHIGAFKHGGTSKRGTELYVFGGTGSYHSSVTYWDKCHDYVWSYDISIDQWRFLKGTKDTTNAAPSYGVTGEYSESVNIGAVVKTHVFDLSNDEIVLYGGYRGNNPFYRYVDIWHYSFSLNMFKHVKGPRNAGVNFASPVYGTTGEFHVDNTPTGLAMATMIPLGVSRWLLIGGHDGLKNRDDIWELDVNLNEWRFIRGTKVGDELPIFGEEFDSVNRQWYSYNAALLVMENRLIFHSGAPSYTPDVFEIELNEVNVINPIPNLKKTIFKEVYEGSTRLHLIKTSLTVNCTISEGLKDTVKVSMLVNKDEIGSEIRTIGYGDIETISIVDVKELDDGDIIEVVMSSEFEETRIVEEENFSFKLVNL